MRKTVFVRDAKTLTDLLAGHGTYTYETAFTVTKIIELTPQQYNTFTENLIAEYAYITENKAMMFVDINQVWHCLLIRNRTVSRGYWYSVKEIADGSGINKVRNNERMLTSESN